MNEPKLQEKAWDKSFEEPIVKTWKEQQSYAFDAETKKPVFSIDTPPPYVNSPIHIGHATTYTLMDMFARFKRMTGHQVLFPLGLDRNGLPIEMAAEKKFNVKLTNLDREEALKKCEAILKDSSDESTDSFYKLGISFNSWKQGNNIGDVYHTDSEAFRTLTQTTFINLWNKGLIYEAEYLTNYCPGCQTTIADSEIDRKQKETNLNHVTFTIKGTKETITIATTRPELLCTAAMIIYHPDDKRYKHLEGKTAITPYYNTEVPIQAHVQADPNFGTGLVFMSSSAGDQDAVRFLREMGITPVSAVGTDGKIKPIGKELAGLTTKQAREKIITILKEKKLLTKQEKLTHSVPICERSKDEIEFVGMKEFYLKQMEFKEELKNITKQLNFYDPHSKQLLLDWVDSVNIDWPLSRRRYYATEIPLWKVEETGEYAAPEPGKYYQPWKEEAPKELQKKHKGKTLIGETRVFDTWFDSSSTPLYIAQWGTEFYERNKPVTLRPQGKEIIRTWLYYTLLKTWLLTGEVAFKDIWINYHVVDEKGKKMSKSLGNGIDPHDIITKYGAEPFRLWCATEGNITSTDLRCSYDRIEGAGKTLTKLWNVARFISMFDKTELPENPEPLDLWITNEMNTLITHTQKCYAQYDFHNPATQLKNFLWETFASHYLELAKKRAYNQEGIFTKKQQDSALATLHSTLETLLKLLAPINPIITAKIYEELTGRNIHEEGFPNTTEVIAPTFTKEQLAELNSTIWKTKKDAGKSLKEPLTKLTIPEHFKPITEDIKHMHSIQEIAYGELNVLL